MGGRRRLRGFAGGLAEGVYDYSKLMLGESMLERRQANAANQTRLSQALDDVRTSLRAMSAPEHVQKVGPERAAQEYAALRRTLPRQLQGAIGQEPDWASLDSSVGEREGGLMKELGAIDNPDNAQLTPQGVRSAASVARVPTEVDAPIGLGGSSSPMKFDDPQFGELLKTIAGQKEGLLAKESRTAVTNKGTGVTQYMTAREQAKAGPVKTDLGTQERVNEAGDTTAAQTSARIAGETTPAAIEGQGQLAGEKAYQERAGQLRAELEQMGITGQQQQAALAMADDFEKQSQEFIQIRSSFKQVATLARDGTGASDIGIIYGVMKAFGAGIVQPGEVATAQNSGSVPERIRARYMQIVNGDKLSPVERTEFVNTMSHLYTVSKQDQDERVQLFTQRSQQLRVPPSLIIREPSEPNAAPKAPAGWKYVPKPGGGWTAVEDTP